MELCLYEGDLVNEGHAAEGKDARQDGKKQEEGLRVRLQEGYIDCCVDACA